MITKVQIDSFTAIQSRLQQIGEQFEDLMEERYPRFRGFTLEGEHICFHYDYSSGCSCHSETESKTIWLTWDEINNDEVLSAFKKRLEDNKRKLENERQLAQERERQAQEQRERAELERLNLKYNT